MFRIVQTANDDVLSEYFRTEIRPMLEQYSTRSSGQVNGVWSARGSGNTGRLYAWQNQNWIFMIQADSNARFDAAVDAFRFISN
ncbi:MAG: hypothetical protein EA383_01920 [Spirochaetaceae bacterium]|nr:MAG: hypothetical protein EA383_01920 [Spirochaetaceae bacterium]